MALGKGDHLEDAKKTLAAAERAESWSLVRKVTFLGIDEWTAEMTIILRSVAPTLRKAYFVTFSSTVVDGIWSRVETCGKLGVLSVTAFNATRKSNGIPDGYVLPKIVEAFQLCGIFDREAAVMRTLLLTVLKAWHLGRQPIFQPLVESGTLSERSEQTSRHLGGLWGLAYSGMVER